jgi:glutathionyl-hydroquinone reductase
VRRYDCESGQLPCGILINDKIFAILYFSELILYCVFFNVFRFICGPRMTFVDLRLFMTLIRFDEVYVVYFKVGCFMLSVCRQRCYGYYYLVSGCTS